ncbi:hypothetical protein ACFPVY_07740 [Flavobacterium qiangtangense]|uniref:WG repeat-containing protein n=1 Tax=Flavobacterium qiangtangense TaxID=1442595 RepID=A0ABW1PLN5_9FLAO
MKKLIILSSVLFLFTLVAQGQTVFEAKAPTGTSSILDFATGTAKGIILPAVESLPISPANGTFLVDKTDQKVKMYQNGIWVELSAGGNTSTIVPYSGTVDNGKQTIIGSRTTSVDGVLVLESANKALVLPKVASPHLNVKSPYPGMICYDTTAKALAVFDGNAWNYWK